MQRNASTRASANPRVGPTLLLLFGGVLLGALDIAIVGPALPAIQNEMALGSQGSAAIFSIYILFSLMAAPLLASLSDTLGRRRIYIVCIAVFGFGSLLVALAPAIEMLLLGRAVQAIGAGGTLPVASAVIADTFPVERRGRALGLIGAVFGLAFVIGPVVGGFLLQWSWRWLFVINLPLAIVLVGYSFVLLEDRVQRQRTAFDYRGMLLLALGLVALAFGAGQLELSSAGVPRVGLVSGLAFAAAVAVLWLFWRIELRSAVPILAPAMLRSRQMRIVAILGFATGLVEASMVFLPTLAVTALAVSASRASFMLIPLVLALIVGSIVAGRVLDSIGPRPVIQFGIACTAIGLVSFALLPLAMTSFFLSGLAVGFGLASLLGAPLRYLALQIGGEAHRGASQGLLTIFLSTGRLFGASLTGGIAASAGAVSLGYRRSMLMIAVACCLALVSTLWLQNRRRQDQVAST